MPKTKVEVYDKDQLIYPYIESDHVTFSNGMKVSEMLDQSISMPTVTHEDLSFKVGVGDQDVSSAIVDSSVSEMTIKGKTYQNILPEPSTHVLTNNKEMFKVNEGLDPNVEIVDAVSKSAILSGSTKYRDILSNKIYDSYESATNVWSTNKYKLWSAQDGGATNELNGTIASGTDIVTLDFHAINHSTYKLTGNCTYKKVVFYDNNQTFISSARTAATTGDLVINNIPSNARYVRFAFFPYEDNTGSCSIVDENNNPINLRQIQLISCKMPVLSTTGKNLIPLKEDWVQGQIMNGGGISVNSYALRTKSKIKVKPNTKYTFSTKSSDCKIAYHEWEANGKYIKDSGWITAFPYTFTTNNKTEYINLTTRRVSNVDSTVDNLDDTLIWQLEESSTATTYEPYKSNILSTSEEVVLRSLPNGVCDTLNLMTGEYVQHIKEVVFDGSSDESIAMANVNDTTLVRFNIKNVAGVQTGNTNKVLCSSLPYLYIHDLSGGSATVSQECISNHSQDANVINIVIKRSRLSSVDVAGFRAYLQSNPITIQYSIATPIIKTVDLSSSGNWEKVVLNGSENWIQSTANNNYFMETFVIKSNYNTGTENLVFSGDHRLSVAKIYTSNTNTGLCIEKGGGLRIRTQQVLGGQSIEDFKVYLSQNPVMVYYQTKNHQDSTQVKQPIFFKDGHIQLSSGADNSLIPTLDYQTKTSNSYVMDLMKSGTWYTMKAKSASGTLAFASNTQPLSTNGKFAIDGASFQNANKLMVINGSVEDLMILEGDLTSKTIPYFKGIKSAFEGEDKIEVLSTGKNLFNVNLIYGAHTYGNIGQKPTHGTGHARITNETGDYILVKPNTKYTFSIGNNFSFAIAQLDKDGISLGDTGWLNNKSSWTITTQSTARYVGFNIRKLDDSDIAPDEVYKAYPMFEETLTATSYEPHKSNSTKIPLLSPLRSLPNGVHDEIILDRENNKAKIIQRVKAITFDGSSDERWVGYNDSSPRAVQGFNVNTTDLVVDKINVNLYCDTLQPNINSVHNRDSRGIGAHNDGSSNSNIRLCLLKDELIPYGFSEPLKTNENVLRKWLQNNPTVVYYELATPIISEVDLEGFTYIYKDGHIFLNSDIAPTTEITYSINQCQQISASNEDIIRHEKELTYLQKLIAQYVQVDYESALLSLKV